MSIVLPSAGGISDLLKETGSCISGGFNLNMNEQMDRQIEASPHRSVGFKAGTHYSVFEPGLDCGGTHCNMLDEQIMH
jgi:hypothetical protein